MAAQPAAMDPSVRSFEATVTSVEGTEVRLDQTFFYAASGGQPADRGSIEDIAVVDVHLDGTESVHTLAEPPSFGEGATITGSIDPAFRTYCQRTHTASHILYGAARGLLEEIGYGGFDIDDRKARIDFETTTDVDNDILVELEERANRAVWESRSVSWEVVSTEEVTNRDGVAYNTKTEEGALGEDDGVRIVEIGSPSFGTDGDWWDRAACGGTHVENTREIGPITVLDRSNPGEGLTRIEFAVGDRAIDHRSEIQQAALRAAEQLGTPIPEMPDRIAQLQAEVEDLSNDLQTAEERLVEQALTSIDPFEKDGASWLVGSLAGVEMDSMAERAREAAGERADVVVLVAEGHPASLAVATTGDIDAEAVVDHLTQEFGGGGGGGAVFAQGGGLDADAETVVEATTSVDLES